MTIEAKWMGINALEFRYPGGSFMIDPYVSRSPEKLHIKEEVDKYITGKPDFVLMTHAHWDHLPDMPQIIEKTGTTLYASESACAIMRKLGVPENKLHALSYGEVLEFPGNVRVTALESRHMGNIDPRRYSGVAEEDFSIQKNWICGEIFAFLIEINGYRILNAGSANFHLPAMDGITCDTFFCGISRWKPGFPELLGHINYKELIPTHHDEFRLPLDQFSLRDDPARLHEALPELVMREIPVLQFVPVA